ncbi:hypothetical protein DB32_002547 [Sandaracinus amylolyticus]|uniref:Uncharacterized protein n=1 Tax=Sandaracinus amylolyticus TaxID=927083 RepID=A0A0F6W1Z9_9BACT|nr:hypothetical protein DB32_002547 [Sandaracinus amylolyticus]
MPLARAQHYGVHTGVGSIDVIYRRTGSLRELRVGAASRGAQIAPLVLLTIG